MRFKLDENFGTRTQQIFRKAGHKVKTVRDQRLQGCSDREIFQTVCSERYCLVTLDLDFSDVTRFPPAEANGLVILRVPRNPNLALLEQMIRQFLKAIGQMPIEKKLWIVEVDRIRIHQSETEIES